MSFTYSRKKIKTERQVETYDKKQKEALLDARGILQPRQIKRSSPITILRTKQEVNQGRVDVRKEGVGKKGGRKDIRDLQLLSSKRSVEPK